MALWEWNGNTRRYRVTQEGAEATGQRAGTFVGASKQVGLRDSLIASHKDDADGLAAQLANGDITIGQWQRGMRQMVTNSHSQQYSMAVGGRNVMTQADWGRVGATVKGQYQYLDNFANQIADGGMTEAQIAARSRMYVEASGTTFERAMTQSRDMPALPQYPGDGGTQCLTNCKCSWVIRETETAWQCTWTLHPAEHCEDCIELSERYNPYTIPKMEASTRSAAMEMLPSHAEH